MCCSEGLTETDRIPVHVIQMLCFTRPAIVTTCRSCLRPPPSIECDSHRSDVAWVSTLRFLRFLLVPSIGCKFNLSTGVYVAHRHEPSAVYESNDTDSLNSRRCCGLASSFGSRRGATGRLLEGIDCTRWSLRNLSQKPCSLRDFSGLHDMSRSSLCSPRPGSFAVFAGWLREGSCVFNRDAHPQV